MANEAVVHNTSDKQHLEKVAKTQAMKQKQLKEDIVALLEAASGRRVLWMLLSECGVFKSSWDPSAKIHFNEGKRNVGLFLMSKITEAKLDALTQMMAENREEEK